METIIRYRLFLSSRALDDSSCAKEDRRCFAIVFVPPTLLRRPRSFPCRMEEWIKIFFRL